MENNTNTLDNISNLLSTRLFEKTLINNFINVSRVYTPTFTINYFESYEHSEKNQRTSTSSYERMCKYVERQDMLRNDYSRIKSVSDTVDHFKIEAGMNTDIKNKINDLYKINTESQFIKTLMIEGHKHISINFIKVWEKLINPIQYGKLRKIKINLISLIYRSIIKFLNKDFIFDEKDFENKLRTYISKISKEEIISVESLYMIVTKKVAKYMIDYCKLFKKTKYNYNPESIFQIGYFNSVEVWIDPFQEDVKKIYIGSRTGKNQLGLNLFYLPSEDELTTYEKPVNDEDVIDFTEKLETIRKIKTITIYNLNLYYKIIPIGNISNLYKTLQFI